MAKRLSLGRLEALIEGLKREIQLNQSTLVGAAQKVISVTGAGTTKVLSASDSGAVILLGGADACTATLPKVKEGLNFTFYTTTEFRHVINGGAAVIQGCIHHNTNLATVARVAFTNASSITLHATNFKIGDKINVYCNGTNWYVDGLVNDAPS
tara:strand:- start:929 stop:1390 length:462 start_codon:yes stop_codon:yes gene_type:complete